ncbi:unnamed protein product [Mytilus coruscus]|uniref:C1q domain-containing protein n=1 Tax=Mytilus coruscus TaxID=42192 RepID=A0A6J8D7N5_MYTCO|nr:unnamed protein product [Mytilus coruscus]
MKRDIHSLKATNQARTQDVIALNTMATSTSKKLDNVSKLLTSNVQIVTTLDSRMTRIESRQSQTSIQLQQTQQTVSNNSRKVMIRTCHATKDSSGLIRFTTIKESKGISNTANFISSGKFTCESAGLYILMVIIFSSYEGADVYIYKNSHMIQNLELHTPSNHLTFESIPGSLALLLNVGDTIYVKSPNTIIGVGTYTCLSIMKIS